MNDDDMPAQPKTLQLPAADKNEILLAELKVLMVSGFKDLDTKVDRLEANLELQGGEIGLVKKEVALIFEWKGDVEQRLKNNSTRAQSAHGIDMEQSAQLAQERSAREELATKVDALTTAIVDIVVPILKRIDALTKNPLVKVIVVLATAVIGSYAASRGLK
jgi:hypothetical protein